MRRATVAFFSFVLIYLALGLSVAKAATIYYVDILSPRVPPGGWITLDAQVSGAYYCDILLDYNYVLDSYYPFYDNNTGNYRIVDMIQIPSWVNEGTHTITLDCYGDTYNLTIIVDVPSLYVYPSNVSIGDILNITVTNIYDMIQTFIITIDDMPLIVFEPSQTSNWTLERSITVPPLTRGWHEVRLYVTVDIFQNMYYAIKTGSSMHDYMYARGLFPERYVLVETARFYVRDGIVVAGNGTIGNVTGELETLMRRVSTLESNYLLIRNQLNEINMTLIHINNSLFREMNGTFSLENQIKLFNNKYVNLNNSVVELRNKVQQNISKLLKQVEKLKKENEELKARLEAQEAELEKLRDAVLSGGRSSYGVAIGLGAAGIFLGLLSLAAAIVLYRR